MINFEGLQNLPLQFSHYDVSLTFEIIASLNAQTDASIAANISQYRTEGPEIEKHEIDAEDNLYHVVEYYMGLDSGSVDLDEMFTSYYPSIIRRSVFLTLYGMLEHDFEKLCNGFARIHNAPVKLSDLKGSGFERCDLYARKIIGMKTSKHYPSVRKVTKLRNACAHNDARFVLNDDKTIPELVELMRTYSTVLVQDNKQVNFKAGSLQAMTHILKIYFNDVEEALKAHKAPNPFI
ncbi:hypothetical protein B1H58_20500 (plasmid) [Pantoea alhagi]|uniref:Cthe-2314-like HEPN domain-containing protein n=1 Tax=Pantoea alhagi TaxID=1891675 RepID=A0A1W6BBJ4_9GAMM|nr:hypothetical protein [Pantoea alhagi]ARJ44403.1 hypothetical protein B1H58_20500 [Pantoea alhagi]